MNYADIMSLPRREPKTRPRMSMESRAAQFAPFSALTGYDDAICETARVVDGKIELSEDEGCALDRKLREIIDDPGREAVVTYFVPDRRKNGGRCLTKRCVIRRVDETERVMILADRTRIGLDSVTDIWTE